MGHSAEWSARSRAQEQRFPLRGAACVAEPNAAERQRLVRALSRMGYIVHETGSGAAAGFIAAQVRLELIVLNLLVGDVRALTLIRQLRRARPDLRIIALAGDGPSAVLELARVAGADAALQSPASSGALARAIAEARRPVSKVTAAGEVRA